MRLAQSGAIASCPQRRASVTCARYSAFSAGNALCRELLAQHKDEILEPIGKTVGAEPRDSRVMKRAEPIELERERRDGARSRSADAFQRGNSVRRDTADERERQVDVFRPRGAPAGAGDDIAAIAAMRSVPARPATARRTRATARDPSRWLAPPAFRPPSPCRQCRCDPKKPRGPRGSARSQEER